ncbi:MAG: hypothetical protein QOK11_869, partial [Pseudonocardiales bacterium]|nr:hypothetical protein [Pseudonocardiales bacterium]
MTAIDVALAGERTRTAARRPLLPASAYQGLVWAGVLVVVVGPLIPLVYASFRSKPYYLPGGVFTV